MKNSLLSTPSFQPSSTTLFMFEKVKALPTSLDWRARRAVTPVQDQGQCGSCWVFGAVAATEGLVKIKTRNLVSLSEQQIIDCTSTSDACNGGWMEQFYKDGTLTSKCGTDLNHIAVVVGYGTSIDGTKYWILKNSWGPDWGEKGYIRVQRGIKAREGMCGIAEHASYPTK
ncbi:unnamed protein product [Fraxinus pennsylvanica]|uniref:Peptidase C1A papain C-terminal domain-containing protein n=1 Tax=Fraxinus pennsylvanica TaxID=56036 RepID=A0AAD2ABJ2_9LAMI|nr:unnamed protein product [Fraxinus pennsylvanica]